MAERFRHDQCVSEIMTWDLSISCGDLAMARDEESALADISSASPNN
jgi:hypothetical protein